MLIWCRSSKVWSGWLRAKDEFKELAVQVAVKKLKALDTSEDFLKEANVMMQLRHDNLVNLFGVVIEVR